VPDAARQSEPGTPGATEPISGSRPGADPGSGSGSGFGREGDPLAMLLARPGAACPHCRYSLAGLAGGSPDRCPECGGGLEAGFVGSTGPRRLRTLMALMFGWLAFAGSMNSARWALIVSSYLERQAAFARAGAARGSAVVVVGGRVLAPGGGVPREWWLEVGGWGLLGAVGLFGVVAALRLRAGDTRGEKRLMLLLVLGFCGYWGYHAIQFGLELAGRLGA
jgi:hypothetical protein